MTPEKRQNFERLLNPRHIAFIGGADAAVAIGEARRAGFAGEMWVVNPRRETLAGLDCVVTIADLPEAPACPLTRAEQEAIVSFTDRVTDWSSQRQVELAKIEKEKQIQAQEIARQQAIEIARTQQEQAVQSAQIVRDQQVQMATVEREKSVAALEDE